jgi:thioredoxin-dependent peroxiredoxin
MGTPLKLKTDRPRPKEKNMRIQTGTPAPQFQTVDIFARSVTQPDSSSTLRQWRLLSFLRNGACAICNLRIHQLIEQYPTLQHAGLEVIAVFESPLESIRQYVGRQDAPFPIIADPGAILYALYGVEISEEKVAQTMQMPETQTVVQEAAHQGFALTPEEGSNFYRIPADFLIDPNGIVQRTHYAEHLTDHLPLGEIERMLEVANR